MLKIFNFILLFLINFYLLHDIYSISSKAFYLALMFFVINAIFLAIYVLIPRSFMKDRFK